MGDLISRQAAINALHDEIVRRRISEDTNDDGALDEFDTEVILRRLPSAHPGRKTGQWEYVDYGGVGNYHCAACREICICNGDYNFCPNCGAKMIKDGES